MFPLRIDWQMNFGFWIADLRLPRSCAAPNAANPKSKITNPKSKAVYPEGWDRNVIAKRSTAKENEAGQHSQENEADDQLPADLSTALRKPRRAMVQLRRTEIPARIDALMARQQVG
jgi:hypothetical protein